MIPVSREGYKFRSDICLPCYLTDREGNLRVSGFMDLAQEIAYWAAEELGFGYTSLHVHHTAWVLSRMHIHFENPARWRDNVKLYTWHKGANGLFYLRDFDLQDQAGNHLVKATSSWVVINEETRRLVRPEDLSSLLETMEKVDDAIAEPAPKLVLPRDAEPEFAGEHTVAYSDIDIVGHTNNVRYIVWLITNLSVLLTYSAALKSFIELFAPIIKHFFFPRIFFLKSYFLIIVSRLSVYMPILHYDN